ncbi:AraC family transcriptional regulator (plasmid) [Bosea sp. F3-2]|nr:AraC family transcriptional regulator [Bosea sp. F3-2]
MAQERRSAARHQPSIAPTPVDGDRDELQDLVAEVRLCAACHLLTASKLSMAQIAHSLGYSGPSSFSRIFMRLMKIQPAIYREQRIAEMPGKRGGAGGGRSAKSAATQQLARDGESC